MVPSVHRIMTQLGSVSSCTVLNRVTAHLQKFSSESHLLYLLRRFLRSRNGVVGGFLVLVLTALALTAPFLSPYDPIDTNVPEALMGPSLLHPFGTDSLGRDIFVRIVFGARTSLYMGVTTIVVAGIIGVTLGLLAGYYGGWLDMLVLAITDILLAFPGVLLALAVVAMLGPGLTNLMIAVGLSWIPSYARLTRGSVLAVKELQYIESARAVGCPGYHILLRHIFPNVMAPVVVLATLGIAQAILAASALSFIGLGVQPPTPEWGVMLSAGRSFIRTAWWISVFPGLAITASVLAFNMLGDGLRDTLDPHLRV